MTQPETLFNGESAFHPEQHGIYQRYRSNGGVTLNTAMLFRARALGESVGTCTMCGHALYVLPSDGHVNDGAVVEFLGFRCKECGHERWSPAGRRMEKSGAHRRQPSGWMGSRFTKLRAIQQPELSTVDADA